MPISLYKYSVLSNPISGTNQKQIPPVQKEAELIKQSEKKTLRDLVDFPSGYTITKNNMKTRMSAEELFDIQYQSGTQLSNGAKLLRPVSFSLGKVDITPNSEFKTFTVTITPTYYRKDSEPISRTMTEKELVDNKALFRGFIKPSSVQKGKYAIAFVDRDGEIQKQTATKEECLKIMEDNFLYL